jgi:hypothetical protein
MIEIIRETIIIKSKNIYNETKWIPLHNKENTIKHNAFTLELNGKTNFKWGSMIHSTISNIMLSSSLAKKRPITNESGGGNMERWGEREGQHMALCFPFLNLLSDSFCLFI